MGTFQLLKGLINSVKIGLEGVPFLGHSAQRQIRY